MNTAVLADANQGLGASSDAAVIDWVKIGQGGNSRPGPISSSIVDSVVRDGRGHGDQSWVRWRELGTVL